MLTKQTLTLPHMMTSSDPRMIASSEFRKTIGKFASGVTVVTVKVAGLTHGMTVSAFFSLSLDPPLVAVAISNRSRLNALLQQADDFGVAILASDQARLSDHFAGRHQEEGGIQFIEIDGVPVISGALAQICCGVAARYDGGDHTIYTGLVRSLKHREDSEPLVHYSGVYRSLTALAHLEVGR